MPDDIKQYLTTFSGMSMGGQNLYTFLLEHGEYFPLSDKSFAGPRLTPQMCYMNAAHEVLKDGSLTYVEGLVTVYGVPIQHAWMVGPDRTVIDPTFRDNPASRVGEYWGIPFTRKYLLRALHTNKVYGLMGWESRKTFRKLVEGKTKKFREWDKKQ